MSRLQSPLAVVLRSDGAHFFSTARICSLGRFRLNASPGHPEVRDGRGVSSKPDHGRNGQGAGTNIGDSRADGVCGAPEESAALPRVVQFASRGRWKIWNFSFFAIHVLQHWSRERPNPPRMRAAALDPRSQWNCKSTFADGRATRRQRARRRGPLNLGVFFPRRHVLTANNSTAGPSIGNRASSILQNLFAKGEPNGGRSATGRSTWPTVPLTAALFSDEVGFGQGDAQCPKGGAG